VLRAKATGRRDLPLFEFAEGLAKYRGTLRAIALSSFGETMLNPDFPAMIDLLGRDYAHLDAVHVITNGSLVQRCPAVGDLPGLLAFSIDAPDRQTYGAMRVGLDFDAVLANLRSMVRRPNHPSRRIGINMAVFERNVGSVYEMARLAHGEGVHSLHVIAGMGDGGSDVVGSRPRPDDPRVAAQIARVRADFPRLEILSDTFDIVPVNRCRMPWISLDVDPDGRTHPCCRAIDVDFGQWVADDPWNNAAMERLRVQLASGVFSGSPAEFRECSACRWR
jgi:MoaA/NifB/PqqE/SkfB family radical SAM enzyme